jgi:hypothetical protein
VAFVPPLSPNSQESPPAVAPSPRPEVLVLPKYCSRLCINTTQHTVACCLCTS